MARFDDAFAPYVPFGSRTLALTPPSSPGTDVAVLQGLLRVAEQVLAPGLPGVAPPISGTYDAATEQAVKNLQSHFGLTADGVAGPATMFLFGQGNGSYVTYGGPAYGTRQLGQGDSGGDVTALQNRLNMFAPYARILGGPATGTFGRATTTAVLALKQQAAALGDSGFPANGLAGYGFYDATWLYTFAGGRGLLAGSGRNGLDVAFVQAVLAKAGHYTGPINGLYNTPTVAAVQTFQRSRGLGADGNVGPSTFHQLGLANGNQAPAPFPVSWPAAAAPGA